MNPVYNQGLGTISKHIRIHNKGNFAAEITVIFKDFAVANQPSSKEEFWLCCVVSMLTRGALLVAVGEPILVSRRETKGHFVSLFAVSALYAHASDSV